MTEQEALICLNAVNGLGNRTLLKMLTQTKSANAIFAKSLDQLTLEYGINSSVALNIIHFPKDEFIKKEIGRAKSMSNQLRIISLFDEEYPECFKHIPDQPVVFYMIGQPVWSTKPCMAIVGSRQASLYGMKVAKEFAVGLAEAGFCIVSGLARGVDTEAHQGALMAKGVTIAVLGSGLGELYPKENSSLAQSITEQGCVISEYPLNAPPHPYHFPRRNRLISGLSKGVIVVEAAEKSGSLITADFALDQGRDVYAVPGSIHSEQSVGVHRLIKQGAKMVTGVNDILEDYQGLHSGGKRASDDSEETYPEQGKPMPELSNQGSTVLELIRAGIYHLDELMVRLHMNPQQVLSVLSNLELQGYIQRTINGEYKPVKLKTLIS